MGNIARYLKKCVIQKTWRSLLFLKSEWLWKKGNSQFDIVRRILKEYNWIFCITFFYKLLGERSHGEFFSNNALQVVFSTVGEILLVFNKEIGEILEFSFLCKFNEF